jgi:hypothetical protein
MQNKQFQFINEKFDYKTLNNFENQIRTKKYSKKDYLKTTNNVDEIMFVKVKNTEYGLLND